MNIWINDDIKREKNYIHKLKELKNENINIFNNFLIWYKINNVYKNLYKDILNKYSINEFWNNLNYFYNLNWLNNSWDYLNNILNDINYLNNKDVIIKNIKFYNDIKDMIWFQDNWNTNIYDYEIIENNIKKYINDIIYTIWYIDNNFLFDKNTKFKDSIYLLSKWWKILDNWNMYILVDWESN